MIQVQNRNDIKDSNSNVKVLTCKICLNIFKIIYMYQIVLKSIFILSFYWLFSIVSIRINQYSKGLNDSCVNIRK